MNYRNKKILEAANGEACTHCNRRDGTVVAAHSNRQSHGKGMGIKAHDIFVAFLCHACHVAYDCHIGFTEDDWAMAHGKTLLRLLDRGILK